MSESKQVATYPSADQRERWEERADELGMSMSNFVEAMVEAGMKKFEPSVTPDESNYELRQQRNQLRTELEEARDRIERLEEEVYRSEHHAIVQYVESNPGATYDQIVQHVLNTVPSRVSRYLEELEGRKLRQEGDQYYPAETGGGSSE